MAKHLVMVGTLASMLAASAGCATQSWVIDTVREMDKDLVARVVRIETAAAAEKARVDQLTAQVGEVRGIATDARSRADVAGQKAEATDGRISRILANRMKRTEVQQLDVTFEAGKATISTGDRVALADVLKVLVANPSYTADVVGYTDTVGRSDSNVGLSWRRSEAVRRFLVERGAELHRFSFIGIGEELAGDDARDAAKRAKNRRVTVVVYKPME